MQFGCGWPWSWFLRWRAWSWM